MLATHPAGNSGLIDTQGISRLGLGTKMLNEVFEESFHIPSPYGNTRNYKHGKVPLQGYGRSLNTDRMEFKDRLRHARKTRKMSQAKLAAAAGLDQTTISDLENGRSRSTGRSAEIALALEVDPTWLATGMGEMDSSGPSNLSSAPQPIRYYRYPIVSQVEAGNWDAISLPYEPGDEQEHQTSGYRAYGRAFWLRVKGDSMTAPQGVTPTIPEGTLVLIDPGVEATTGKLVVARMEGDNEATFKKLVEDGGRRYLKALNPSYPLIEINGNCRIVGVAIEALTKL